MGRLSPSSARPPETKLGEFTEFIITLPRDNGAVVAEKSE